MLTAGREVTRTIIVLLGFAIPGCAGDGGTATRSAEWSGTARDSAGIRVVSNPQAGIWTDETRWSAAVDLAIGVREGDPEYQFARIADVDAGPDGRMYVLDNQTARVSVYEADGRYALSFGKLGRGPGEFSIDAFAVRVDATGTVFVRDGINRRDNLFGADGTYLRSVPLGGPWKEWATLPDGSRVERSSNGAWDGIVHVGSDGEVIDTVLAFEYDMTRTRGALSTSANRVSGGRTEIPLLPPSPSWAVTSDGRVIAGISDGYRIEVRDPDGTLRMLVEKDHGPLAMSSEDRSGMTARIEELIRAAGLTNDQVHAALQRFSYLPPDSLPAFTGLAGGPGGTIWVQGVLPIASMTANAVLDALNAGSPVWDVFCGDGRYLSQVVLPSSFNLKEIRGSHIYGIEIDDLDVQRVVRLEIRPATQRSEVPFSCG